MLPFLVHFGRDNQRHQRRRTAGWASSQHPIALGCALAMCVPIAFTSRRAREYRHRRLWLAASGLICMGAMATVSRTVILMLLAMGVCAFWIFGRKLLLLAAPDRPRLDHALASPGVVSHLYKRFNPKGGIVTQLDSRAACADRGGSPISAQACTRCPRRRSSVTARHCRGRRLARDHADDTGLRPPIIFDDQYMNTLVSLGSSASDACCCSSGARQANGAHRAPDPG